jgi:hypothetical protein
MEYYVLCSKNVKSFEELQTCINDLGFDLKIQLTVDLNNYTGHLNALWRGREAGFEFSSFSPSELLETYSDVDFGGPWPQAYVLYVGTLTGCVGACIATAALARITGGLVFDPQEDDVMSAEDATTRAAHTETDYFLFGFADQEKT